MTIQIRNNGLGIAKYGYNAATASGDTIWTNSNAFPWTEVGTNETTTIESSDVADDTGGTGAITVEIEGLVEVTLHEGTEREFTGMQITKETATLDGTTAVTLTNLFAFIYRAVVKTTGSGNANAGNILFKHGTDVIAHILIGANNTEMCVMIIPDLDEDGLHIQDAYFVHANANMAKNTTAIAELALLKASRDSVVFAIQHREVVTQSAKMDEVFALSNTMATGSRIELRALTVSAGCAVSGRFSIKYNK